MLSFGICCHCLALNWIADLSEEIGGKFMQLSLRLAEGVGTIPDMELLEGSAVQSDAIAYFILQRIIQRHRFFTVFRLGSSKIFKILNIFKMKVECLSWQFASYAVYLAFCIIPANYNEKYTEFPPIRALHRKEKKNGKAKKIKIFYFSIICDIFI